MKKTIFGVLVAFALLFVSSSSRADGGQWGCLIDTYVDENNIGKCTLRPDGFGKQCRPTGPDLFLCSGTIFIWVIEADRHDDPN